MPGINTSMILTMPQVQEESSFKALVKADKIILEYRNHQHASTALYRKYLHFPLHFPLSSLLSDHNIFVLPHLLSLN